MYYQKSGTPITYHFEYDDITGKYNRYITQEGKVDYKQWLGNIGIQYNLIYKSSNTFLFNGGVILTKASEKIKNSDAGVDAKGLSGYFLGAGYERKILDRFSIFSEIQYNFNFPILKSFSIDYGGVNFNIGVRGYFSQK